MKLVDHTGKRFGKLVVLRRATQNELAHLSESYRKKVYWICECDCGGDKIAKATDLVSGRTLSCGCLKKLGLSERMHRYWRNKKRIDDHD